MRHLPALYIQIAPFVKNFSLQSHRTYSPPTETAPDRVSGTITHLVIHRGLIFAERLVIPVSTVEDLGAERVLIAGANEMLDRFAHYTPESMDRVLAE